MANLRDKHAVLCEGSEALKELVENYATMDVEAFCAKWGIGDLYSSFYGIAEGFTPFSWERG